MIGLARQQRINPFAQDLHNQPRDIGQTYRITNPDWTKTYNYIFLALSTFALSKTRQKKLYIVWIKEIYIYLDLLKLDVEAVDKEHFMTTMIRNQILGLIHGVTKIDRLRDDDMFWKLNHFYWLLRKAN